MRHETKQSRDIDATLLQIVMRQYQQGITPDQGTVVVHLLAVLATALLRGRVGWISPN